jgi:DNA gyrase/topoisomerase IV subunit B
MTQKTVEQRYRKLSDVEHVLIRPGRYLGSVSEHRAITWIPEGDRMVYQEITWHPALLKMFDEIISNSVDESTRNPKLNEIKVQLAASGEMSVWDNGGIPIEKHKEYDEWIPELIFGSLRSGSNFDDTEDSTVTGQNGEGSSLVNIFSKEFNIETCDRKNEYLQTFTENSMKRTTPDIHAAKSKLGYTRISWLPDYDKLKTSFHDGNVLMLFRRVWDIAGCNPHLKLSINDEPIKVNSFKDYVTRFTDEYIYDENNNWMVAVGPSDGSFQHVSFVNSTCTTTGGTHVQYLANEICNRLRDYFHKKHKVDVKPSEIRNHIRLYINAKIVNPRYSSQTKDDMISEQKDWKHVFEVSDKFVKQITESSVVQKVLDWIQAKLEAQRLAELRKLNKENSRIDPRRIVKLTDATERQNRTGCSILICEGDSAASATQSARDPRWIGCYPLKGKPLNVDDIDVKRLVANEEFTNLMLAIGLRIGEPVNNITELRYGRIGFMTDADHDGTHICGLLINMFYRFWPELFKMGAIYRFRTPVIRATIGKDEHDFFNEDEYEAWVPTKKPDKVKWLKGLGSHKTESFRRFFANMDHHLIPLSIDDAADVESINLSFNRTRADDRKVWLDLTEKYER